MLVVSWCLSYQTPLRSACRECIGQQFQRFDLSASHSLPDSWTCVCTPLVFAILVIALKCDAGEHKKFCTGILVCVCLLHWNAPSAPPAPTSRGSIQSVTTSSAHPDQLSQTIDSAFP